MYIDHMIVHIHNLRICHTNANTYTHKRTHMHTHKNTNNFTHTYTYTRNATHTSNTTGTHAWILISHHIYGDKFDMAHLCSFVK